MAWLCTTIRFCQTLSSSREFAFRLAQKPLAVYCSTRQSLPSKSLYQKRCFCTNGSAGGVAHNPHYPDVATLRQAMDKMEAGDLIKSISVMPPAALCRIVAETVRRRLASFPSSKLGAVIEQLRKGLQPTSGNCLQELVDECLDNDDVHRSVLVDIARSLMFVRWINQEKLFARLILEFEESLEEFDDAQLLVVAKSFVLQQFMYRVSLPRPVEFLNGLLKELERRIDVKPVEFAVNALGAVTPAKPRKAFIDAVERSVSKDLASVSNHRLACFCRDLYELNYKRNSFRHQLTLEIASRLSDLKPWQIGYSLLLLPKENKPRDLLREHLSNLLTSQPQDFLLVATTAFEASRSKHGKLLNFFASFLPELEQKVASLFSGQALVVLSVMTQACCCSAAFACELTDRFLTGAKIAMEDICTFMFWLGHLYTKLEPADCASLMSAAKKCSQLNIEVDSLSLSSMSKLCSGLKDLHLYHSEWCDMISVYLLRDVTLCSRYLREVVAIVSYFGVVGHQVPRVLVEKLGEALDSKNKLPLSFNERVEVLVACVLNNVFPIESLGAVITDELAWNRGTSEVKRDNGRSLIAMSALAASKGKKLSALPPVPSEIMSHVVDKMRSSRLSAEVHACLDNLDEVLGEKVLCRRLITGRGLFVAAGFYLAKDNLPLQWLQDAFDHPVNDLHYAGVQPVAVLAHSPSDFVNHLDELLGRFLLEKRCLQACGWLTVVLPVHKWQVASDRRSFLVKALQEGIC